MTRRRSWLTAVAVLLVVVTAAADVAEAQRRGGRGFGRGDRGGRFGRGGRDGLLGRVFRDSVEQELKLTEDQQERLRELAENSRPDRSDFREVFQRMREADSDEEREAIREEMQRRREEREKEIEEKLKQVLDTEQFARLKQLALHDRGPRALRDDEVAARLELSDAQQTKIESMLDSQRDEQRALFDQVRSGEIDRDAMREKSEEMRRKLESELLGILNEEQKTSWKQMLGPPPPEPDDDTDGPGGRFRGFGGNRDGGWRGGRDRGRPRFSDNGDSGQAGSENGPTRSSTNVLPNGEEVSDRQAASFSTGDAQDAATEADEASDAAATATETGGEEAPRSAESSSTSETDASADNPKRLSFNFRETPWEDVLKLFARTAGLTLDLNDVPPGTFSYYDTRSYTPSEALDILNGYLLPKGYILVRRNRFLVVLNLENGVPPNLVPDVSVNQLPDRGDNELMRVVFPLDENADPEVLAGEIEQLLGPQGKAVPLSASHSVAVTDIGSNLRRVHELIEGGAGTQDPEDLVFKALPLAHIPATDAERYVRALFGLGSQVENVSAAAERDDRRSRWRRWRRGRDDDDDDDRSRRNSRDANGASQVNVTADLRTNSLLAKAPAREMKLIEQVVEAIDVEQNAVDTQVASAVGAPELRVYEVEDADAREVAKTLDAMMSGVVVNEDGRNDRLHIRATPAEHQQIEQWIRQLDGVGSTQVAIVPVAGLDPSMASSMLNSLFLSDGNDAPTIQPNLMGRGLIVRGTPAQVAQVRTVLAQQGLTGGRDSLRSNGGGKVRRFSFGGRDPQEFARLIERLWSSTGDNPLRVVVPEPPNPIREERVPDEREPESPRTSTNETHFTPGKNGADARRNRSRRSDRDSSPDTPRSEDRPIESPRKRDLNVRNSGRDRISVRPATLLAQADSQPARRQRSETESPPTNDSSGDAGNEQSSDDSDDNDAPPVTVSVTDGQVIIASDDEEALDRLERIIQSLAQSASNQTRWTVFYLRSADCTDAAIMLEQIIPGSSVTTPTDGLGGLAPLGNTTATPALQSLRIIPEERSNALFVSGTPSQVRQVEDVLKILDASELPQQLRDRMPRYIELEHADATRVADIIKDVYQDNMGPSNGRGDRDNDRRRGPGGNSNQQPVQLTVGVDTRTNAVVVSADEALYQEIRELVSTLEDAAQEANRTVRVVTLQNTDSTDVQQALSSLLPKVNVSISGSETRTSGTQRGGPQDSRRGRRADDDDDDRRDRIREFFRRRMQERGRGGRDDDDRRFRGRGRRGGFPFGRRGRDND